MDKIRVQLSGEEGDTAYIQLPGHSDTPGSVRRTVALHAVIDGYRGPLVHIDFDAGGRAVGIEILVRRDDES